MQALSAPMGRGWEYMEVEPRDVVEGVVPVYGFKYNMIEDARQAGKNVNDKIQAKSVEAGKYDLVLDPSHLWLTIHESVGHPLELDRVLGYEANYAGTSFATVDKWKAGDFNYGSDKVTLFADKIQGHSLGAVRLGRRRDSHQALESGQRWHSGGLSEDPRPGPYPGPGGVRWLLLRGQLGLVQFQRMPNVSLAAGRKS